MIVEIDPEAPTASGVVTYDGPISISAGGEDVTVEQPLLDEDMPVQG